MSKQIVWAWVDSEMKDIARKVAKAQGVSLSEYVRNLIIKDLERRSIITTKIDLIKQEIRNSKLKEVVEK